MNNLDPYARFFTHNCEYRNAKLKDVFEGRLGILCFI
jgi:hypothetical protein